MSKIPMQAETGRDVWVVFTDIYRNNIYDATGLLVSQDKRWLCIRDDNDKYCTIFDCPRSHILRLEEIPCQH